MGDNTVSEPTNQPQEPAKEPAPEPKQEETDWKAEARKWEARAKENKTAAEELTSLKDSQKTAEQKFEERLAEMEKRAAGAELKTLRSDTAVKFGISAEDRDLFLTGTDEETLAAQAKRLAAREADRKKQGNVAPKEGANPSSNGGDEDLREFTRKLFNKQE